MSEARLDQLVKGAPIPDKQQPTSIPTTGVLSSFSDDNPHDNSGANPLHPSDPIASLPSSPPQIYLNLLILEASLRAQYLELRARRRQYTFFLTLLGLWIFYFTYALFFAPREDGSGMGGSVYWVVEVTEKVCFMGGIVTAILVWGTGQWERGVRWPRRWVGVTNRGLRGFNCKIVVVRGSWWKEWLDALRFFFSYGLFLGSGTSSYRYVDHHILAEVEREGGGRGEKFSSIPTTLPNIHEDDISSPLRAPPSRHMRSAAGSGSGSGHEEDLAPGGDTIALLLLPKPFSPAFRENWDLYRTEYWERENTRRHAILARIKAHERRLRQRQTWWNRWRHPAHLGLMRGRGDVEKSHHGGAGFGSHVHRQTTTTTTTTHGGLSPASGTGLGTTEKRLRSGSVRSGSHSRGSSRSTTPTPEGDTAGNPPSRRGSNASVERRKKRAPGSSAAGSSASSRVQKLTPSNSASNSQANTPTMPAAEMGPASPLKRENSFASVSSSGESGAGLGISGTTGGDGDSVRSSGRGSERANVGRRSASD